MTLIVLLQARRFLLYFHVCSFYSSSPEGLCQISRCGSFLPSYPLSSFGVVPGSCVSSIIPSSWNIRHLRARTEADRWLLCPGNGTHSPGSPSGLGEQTQTALGDLVNHGHRLGFLHRENPSGSIRSQLGLDFICFSIVAGASESFRMISLIVLM